MQELHFLNIAQARLRLQDNGAKLRPDSPVLSRYQSQGWYRRKVAQNGSAQITLMCGNVYRSNLMCSEMNQAVFCAVSLATLVV